MEKEQSPEGDSENSKEWIQSLRTLAHRLAGDLDPLLDRIGDARATDMADEGMVNVGQLARERYGEEKVVLVGFGSYRGSVVAAVE